MGLWVRYLHPWAPDAGAPELGSGIPAYRSFDGVNQRPDTRGLRRFNHLTGYPPTYRVGVTRGHTSTTGFAAGLVVGMALIGCGAQGHDQLAGRAAPKPAASMTAGASPGATPASPVPSATQKLPAGCASVLSTTELDKILGHRLTGTTRPIRGVAEPRIGRTGRLTCQYGIETKSHPTRPGAPSGGPSATGSTAPDTDQSTGGVVPVELSLSTYRDRDAASQRVDFTIHEAQATGASATDATVAGVSAILLTDRSQSTLVLSYDRMTLALSLAGRVVPRGRIAPVATEVGGVVMRHLGLGVSQSD